MSRNRQLLAKAIRCRPIGLARGTTTTTTAVIVMEHYEHAVSHEIANLADSIASIANHHLAVNGCSICAHPAFQIHEISTI
ncbi:hypothetical protein WN51_00244 [Melipona quadrifasciata]|uniref:Uncharacterized protein n=1 Tax=Melipona quadrifasciata TaxID=166423 RepID=A0A0N0BGB3_9HYME|nr:hypothetical protein WN51_00244 [Melipona quadrifasciata]